MSKEKRLIIVIAVLLIGLTTWWFRNTAIDSQKPQIVFAEGTQPIAAPVYVAQTKGFFQEEGLDVKLASFPTGKLCLDAVLGGKAIFGTVAETPVMHAAFQRQPVRIVATIHRSRENTFMVANKVLGVDNPNDLAGKTIGVPIGTNAEYALSTFLNHCGVASGKVKTINLSPPEMIGPLKRGDVAAIVGWQPHIGRAKAALGEDAVVFSFSDVYQETYNIVATAKYIQSNPDSTKRMLRALSRAVEFIKTHRHEAIQIVADRIGMRESELEQLWDAYHFALDLNNTLVETLTSQARWSINSGHQSGEPPVMRDFVAEDSLRAVAPDSIHL